MNTSTCYFILKISSKKKKNWEDNFYEVMDYKTTTFSLPGVTSI